jgi:hypothetical protein
MKVSIGPYTDDLIPVRKWERAYEVVRSDAPFHEEKDWNAIDKIAYKIFDKVSDLCRPINRWSNNRRRNIKIHIDNYDVWSMDHTLALIIVPMLRKLREQKNGCPHVDNEDVPEILWSTQADIDRMNFGGETDSNWEARWNWVLDEMIWTFEQHAMDDDSSQFHHHSDNLSITFENTDIEGYQELKIGPKDPAKPHHFYDREAHVKHDERKANGRRLFAKFYPSLWD